MSLELNLIVRTLHYIYIQEIMIQTRFIKLITLKIIFIITKLIHKIPLIFVKRKLKQEMERVKCTAQK
jgi:hypothetical protein